MESRQQAQQFIKECGFKTQHHYTDRFEVNKSDFNDTKLAIFLKNYATQIIEKYAEETGKIDPFDFRIWWERNNATL